MGQSSVLEGIVEREHLGHQQGGQGDQQSGFQQQHGQQQLGEHLEGQKQGGVGQEVGFPKGVSSEVTLGGDLPVHPEPSGSGGRGEGV